MKGEKEREGGRGGEGGRRISRKEGEEEGKGEGVPPRPLTAHRMLTNQSGVPVVEEIAIHHPESNQRKRGGEQ